MIQTNNLPLTAGRVEISATGKTPTVNILAYSGGLMHVPGWGHLVIDLTGLDLSSSQIGILSDHDATLKGIVSHGQAEVRNGKLLVAVSSSRKPCITSQIQHETPGIINEEEVAVASESSNLVEISFQK